MTATSSPFACFLIHAELVHWFWGACVRAVYIQSKGISKDWLENPQFGFFLKTETKTTLSCLMHYHVRGAAYQNTTPSSSCSCSDVWIIESRMSPERNRWSELATWSFVPSVRVFARKHEIHTSVGYTWIYRG